MSTKTYTLLGASNHVAHDRAKNDLYTSDPIAVKALLDNVKFKKRIYEPAAGLGHISEPFKSAGYTVKTNEPFYYGYQTDTQEDFLKITDRPFTEPFDIVTNPPYKLAFEFLEHALKMLNNGERVVLLLRIQFLEGIKRGQFFKENPPQAVYVFSRRVQCLLNGQKQNNSSALCYAWFIFEKGYKGEPVIRWLLND